MCLFAGCCGNSLEKNEVRVSYSHFHGNGIESLIIEEEKMNRSAGFRYA
jgi:hypothetical protein